jgi:hypothetical protein
MSMLVDGLSTTWFKVEMDGKDKAVVTFSNEFHTTTGDKSVITWWVERDAETGKWHLVFMETEEDEF